MITQVFLLTVAIYGCLAQTEPDPTYDHQTKTYTTAQKPAVTEGKITIQPVFSPESSTSSLTALVQSAQETIDIGTPGFSSWSGCTPFADPGDCMKGCTPVAQRNESFPIFGALLNALHRGVKVRIVTNNYGTLDCTGTISPLNFLALNGAKIAYYASTTFIHEKYISVDGAKASVSSINFSETSFLKNREAGGIISGEAAQPLLDMMKQVYDLDFQNGVPCPPNSTGFSIEDMVVIQDTSTISVVIPPHIDQNGYFSPSVQDTSSISATATVKVVASPDFAALELQHFLSQASKSLDISIYEISNDAIADTILYLWRQGVKIRLLVSSSIFGKDECGRANAVYQRLYDESRLLNTSDTTRGDNEPISILKTTRHYTYSHQKFWIVDGDRFAWSTGNMAPSDFPDRTNSLQAQTFPTYGEDGWWKTNRDYTVYVSGSSELVQPFLDVFEGDSDADGTFEDKVYPWTPKYTVQCGSGV